MKNKFYNKTLKLYEKVENLSKHVEIFTANQNETPRRIPS